MLELSLMLDVVVSVLLVSHSGTTLTALVLLFYLVYTFL
jgi:hypothetical protein